MKRFFFLLLLLAFATTALALSFQETCRVRIENKKEGEISVSLNQGLSWEAIGRVLKPAEEVSHQGYAAAQWIEEGRVAGTAVNAVHFKIGAKGDRAVFSILPRQFSKAPQNYRSYYKKDSSINTDIPAGEGIFGGQYTPYVGNKVKLVVSSGELITLRKDYCPKLNDVYYIIVGRPVRYPKEIVFENCFGGKVVAHYFSADSDVLGVVLRPVLGIGRFEGSVMAGPGRVRANHPGVIDISVSPPGAWGGFQIVPAKHADSLAYVREKTQWMVVGPVDASDGALEGEAPLFRYFIRPSYNPNDIYSHDWDKKFLQRFLVEVKYTGQDAWQPMPIFALGRDTPLPDWANRALSKVTHFRLFFPIDSM